MCHYTTLWNVSVLRITIKNKTTFVATHFKKLTTETTCLLSQLLSKKSRVTVFTSKCLPCCWTTHPTGDATDWWPTQRQWLSLAGWLSRIINTDRPSVEGHLLKGILNSIIQFVWGPHDRLHQRWSRKWSVASPAWVRHLIFHEVVQWHTWDVVGSIVTVTLQIVSWFWQ